MSLNEKQKAEREQLEQLSRRLESVHNLDQLIKALQGARSWGLDYTEWIKIAIKHFLRKD